jgi:hypothetical protein
MKPSERIRKIEAIKWKYNVEEMAEFLKEVHYEMRFEWDHVLIKTAEGDIIVGLGDYIIKIEIPIPAEPQEELTMDELIEKASDYIQLKNVALNRILHPEEKGVYEVGWSYDFRKRLGKFMADFHEWMKGEGK